MIPSTAGSPTANLTWSAIARRCKCSDIYPFSGWTWRPQLFGLTVRTKPLPMNAAMQ
jgi:hypothetical protein